MLFTMWLQGEVSGDYVRILTIFVGLVAFALLVQGIAVAIIAVKAVAFMKDVKEAFDETKGKAMPLIAKFSELTSTTQGIIVDLVPKIKIITENAVEMSHTARQTVTKLDVTIRDVADRAGVTFADVDSKTHMQVARIDGMIATTLAATAELGATINEGIRVPARKIAVIVNQSKHFIETLVDRARTLGFSVRSTMHTKPEKKPAKFDW